jgi:hypothetical protein
MDDWLGEQAAADAVREQRAEGFRIAQLYTVFETDERAREILRIWDTTLLRRRTSVNAPHTEYAANEALRAFVDGIHEQLRLAKTTAR